MEQGAYDRNVLEILPPGPAGGIGKPVIQPEGAVWWQSELPLMQGLQAAQKPKPQGAGRLIFAMDATGSRAASWSKALIAQSAMFEAVAATGGLSVQLVYFGGGHCRSSKWVSDARQLSDLMHAVTCESGSTQIERVFDHVIGESKSGRVAALVYVGDAIEERLTTLTTQAKRLGGLGVRGFFVQEGDYSDVEQAYRQLAKSMSGGFARLGPNAVDDLKQFLSAVAVYAAGGKAALTARAARDGASQRLLAQLH